jgi:hypothetical protein
MARNVQHRFVFRLLWLSAMLVLVGLAGFVAISKPSLIREIPPDFSSVDAAETDSLVIVRRVVDTASCVIPDYDPYNFIINRTLSDPSPDFVRCNTSWPLLTDVVNGQVVRVNDTLKRALEVTYCEYQEVSYEQRRNLPERFRKMFTGNL